MYNKTNERKKWLQTGVNVCKRTERNWLKEIGFT